MHFCIDSLQIKNLLHQAQTEDCYMSGWIFQILFNVQLFDENMSLQCENQLQVADAFLHWESSKCKSIASCPNQRRIYDWLDSPDTFQCFWPKYEYTMWQSIVAYWCIFSSIIFNEKSHEYLPKPKKLFYEWSHLLDTWHKFRRTYEPTIRTINCCRWCIFGIDSLQL